MYINLISAFLTGDEFSALAHAAKTEEYKNDLLPLLKKYKFRYFD